MTSTDRTNEIPAGMKPWDGGETAPFDWDGHRETTRMRDGRYPSCVMRWKHLGQSDDIVAYTPKDGPADLPLGVEPNAIVVPNSPWYNLHVELGATDSFGKGSVHIAQNGHSGIDRLVLETENVPALVAALLSLAPITPDAATEALADLIVAEARKMNPDIWMDHLEDDESGNKQVEVWNPKGEWRHRWRMQIQYGPPLDALKLAMAVQQARGIYAVDADAKGDEA